MKTKISFVFALFFLIRLLNAQAVGQTTGDFSVSSTGGANYTIPIANLPSIKNAVPNISLNYSSQSKNGIAGWGWNVSGGSSITRISATKFHDGVIDAVNYNDKDRFALDGQRLILKSGIYGGDGAEYQTENYSNVKVISYGVSSYGANYGPSYFVVYYPNGNTAIYGNNPNSQNQLEWKVNYIDDVKYNRIEFSYFKDNDNIYLSSVKYGGNLSLGAAQMNTVNLFYKNRTRNEQMYVYGSTSYAITKELDRVEVLGNGQLFRKYQLTYDTTSLGYERLIQVQEFNGTGESVKPITFEYDTTENGVINNPNAVISNVSPAYDSNNWKYLAGYFDNDASIDFFTYPNSKDKLYRFNSSQLLTTNSNVSGNLINVEKFSEIFSTKLLLANNKFNNLDAVTTIGAGSIVSNQEIIKVNNYVSNSSYSSLDLINTKTYSFPVAQNQSCVIIGGNDTRYAKISKKFFSGDFNGDGLSDIIALTLPYNQTYTYYCGSTKLDSNGRPSPNCCEGNSTMEYSQAYLLDLNPNSPQTPINIGGNYVVKSSSRIYVGELEGDGKADLFILNGGQVTVYGVENNELVQKTVVNNSAINFDYPSYLTDLNGDGKTDIVIPTAEGSSDWFHLISNGQSFTQVTKDLSMVFRKSEVKNTCYTAANGLMDCGYVQQVIYYNFADVNGDGKADLFYHSIFAPYGEFVWAVVYVAAIVGAIMGATSYVGQAIQTGDWSWGKFGMSVLGGAVSGAIMGTLTAVTGGSAAALSWGAIAGYAATGFVGSFMSFNIDLGGGFSIGVSPAIAFGNSFSVGASLNVSYRKGNLSFSASIAGSYYSKHAGSGVSGWGYRYSAMIGYESKNFSFGLGTNKWGGIHAQQTGIIRLGSGDFSLTYENDGSPFDKVGAGILGDGHDRWRTAAMTINVGDFHAGFNLFTGERRSESYSYDEQHTMPELLHDDYYGNPNGKIGIGYGATNKYGAVQETGPRYRLGAAYIGWGNYRIGIDSDRHVRHPIQNIGAHTIVSPQPGFEVLSGGVKPYFQYQTINPFTSW